MYKLRVMMKICELPKHFLELLQTVIIETTYVWMVMIKRLSHPKFLLWLLLLSKENLKTKSCENEMQPSKTFLGVWKTVKSEKYIIQRVWWKYVT